MECPASVRDIAVVIPTYKAQSHFDDLTRALDAQGIERSQILVIDSSSPDGTAEAFQKYGVQVQIIPQVEFNHGGTRKRAVELIGSCELVAFLTQDCLPQVGALAELRRAFIDPRVGMAYGRQVPRQQARAIERHARLFNYPASPPETRTLEDRERLGIKAIFCSDSFAMYRRSALLEIGNFPDDAFFGEDQITAGQMLMAGWKLAYRPTALARHSHDYSIREDFSRYFDVGVFHARNPWLLKTFGHAESEGLRFIRSELIYLAKHEPLSILSALTRTLAKYAGYRIGRWERCLSKRMKARLSAFPGYWRR